MKRSVFFFFFLLFFCLVGAKAQPSGNEIEKVYVVFKTHLDVGFTNLSSVVTKSYVNDFIPKAIEVGDRLRATVRATVTYGLPAHGLYGNTSVRHLPRL